MSRVVHVTGARTVVLADEPQDPLLTGHVRVETWYSGISAGTELTAYRGSNPYLSKTWNAEHRLFVDGGPTFTYPVAGWGYGEVGQVVEVADDVVAPRVGEVVFGAWGHRSSTVLPAPAVAQQALAPGFPAVHGVFARVGAIALNAVLAADVHVGEDVTIFGQGVIGLLATRLAVLNGGRVTAVDALPRRLALARSMGASAVVPAEHPGGAAAAVRAASAGHGADTVIELSGSYRALHEAIRTVVQGGRVVAAGFYQGEGAGLRLGEEFHHNQVEIVASQIGAVPRGLSLRWDRARLLRTFMALAHDGRVDLAPLVSHVVDADDVAIAFQLLDERPGEALQVVLRFPAAPAEARHEEPAP